MKRCLIFLGALLLSGSAFAANTPATDKPLVSQSLDSFNTEAAKIREEMKPGGAYSHIQASDRGRVEARLSEMEKLLSTHSGQGDMRAEDKVQLVNAQEEVNGILHHNDNNRLVCEHVAPVGSHVPVTTCRTFGEIMEQHKSDQDFLRRQSMTRSMSGN
jgi:hypothetical protein